MTAPNGAPLQAAPKPAAPPPSMCMTFGPLGSGKSTDLVATGAGNWWFFAPPGGLRVGRSILGIDISARITEVWCLDDILPMLPAIREAGYGGVGVDDASILLDHSLQRTKAAFGYLKEVPAAQAFDGQSRLNPGISAGHDGKFYRTTGYDRELWPTHERMLDDFAQKCRYLGLHSYMVGHVQEPYTDKQTARRMRGGMNVGWAKITPELPEKADLVQMAIPWPDAKEWDTRCSANRNHPDYAMKDRHGVLPAHGGPLNTAEVLREYARRMLGDEAAMVSVPRPAGLEWMEAFAERAAQRLLAGTPEAEVIKAGGDYLKSQNIPFSLAQWAIRDGVHRGRLRLHAQSGWARL